MKEDNIMSEAEDLKKKHEDENAKGYGKTISTEITTLTIVCESGRTYKVRHKDKGKDWSGDKELKSGGRMSFPIATTEEISLNGDGSSDDVKINDTKGYIEYKSTEKEGALGLSSKNIWANLITWNERSKSWLLNPVFDSIDKHDALIVPSVTGAECILTLLKGHSYGRKISSDFTNLRITNNTSFDFPIKTKKDGDWHDQNALKANASSDFSIRDIQMISLNGGGESDDIKINDEEGYIEYTPAKVKKDFVVYSVGSKVWITQVWWNPTVQNWFGAPSQSDINGHDDLILQPTGFDTKNRTITFAISAGGK